MAFRGKVSVVALTHRGKMRARNEDTIGVGAWIKNKSMSVPSRFEYELGNPLLCVVADGMGGHSAGDVASAFVVDFMLKEAGKTQDLEVLIKRANRELFELMNKKRELLGMGCTIVGFLIHEDVATWFNVGDSRLYRIRNGFIRQLSVDDIPDPTRSNIQHEHRITQAIGGGSRLLDISPHIGTEPLNEGWQYLLCSDGLTDMIGFEEIEKILNDNGDEPVARLFQAAMQNGGKDNISIVLISIER